VGFVDIAEEASRALVAEIQKETGTAPLSWPAPPGYCRAQAAIEKIRIGLGDIGVLINNAENDERHKLDQSHLRNGMSGSR